MHLSRRLLAASLLLVVAIGAPTGAWAAFSAKASGAVSAGTLLLEAPADVYGTFNCPGGAGLTRGGVVVTGWERVTGADSYTLTLDPPRNVANVVRSATGSSNETMQPAVTPRSGTWVLTIVAKAKGWTGPAWRQAFTC